MSEIEKQPSEFDLELADRLAEIFSPENKYKRNSHILQNYGPGSELGQGHELLYRNMAQTADEIITLKDLDRVNVETVLKGYIAAGYLEANPIKGIFAQALERKGIKDLKYLDTVILISERSDHNVSPSHVLIKYRQGEGN